MQGSSKWSEIALEATKEYKIIYYNVVKHKLESMYNAVVIQVTRTTIGPIEILREGDLQKGNQNQVHRVKPIICKHVHLWVIWQYNGSNDHLNMKVWTKQMFHKFVLHQPLREFFAQAAVKLKTEKLILFTDKGLFNPLKGGCNCIRFWLKCYICIPGMRIHHKFAVKLTIHSTYHCLSISAAGSVWKGSINMWTWFWQTKTTISKPFNKFI